MLHRWHRVIDFVWCTIQVSKINAQADLPRLLTYRNKVRNPCWMTNFINDSCIRQLVQLFRYEGFKWWMDFPWLPLKWLNRFFDWNHMLDYSMWYVFRSSYVHANTSRYCLNKRTKACRSYCMQDVPRLKNFGSCFVPRFICSCVMVELWILLFLGPWKWFCKS